MGDVPIQIRNPKFVRAIRALVEQTRQPITEAAKAFDRFGRRSPASLNLGDCFAYELAMREGEGLLFKANDFPKADVKSVL